MTYRKKHTLPCMMNHNVTSEISFKMENQWFKIEKTNKCI